MALISVVEAARRKGVKGSTIRKWFNAGLIQGRRESPRIILIDEDSLKNVDRGIGGKPPKS